MEVEGTTTFSPPPAPSHRYIIKLKNDKLSIWMENRSSKKQWYKGGLEKTDYVTTANTVMDASAYDYVQCFHDELNCELDNSNGVQRTLTALKGDILLLEVTMKIRILRSTWVAKFSFCLDPVSVERIDVLESMLRDQHDTMKRMDTELRELKAGQVPTFIQLKATWKSKTTSVLCWEKASSAAFQVEETGAVKVVHSGVYSITGVVSCESYDSRETAVDQKREVYPSQLLRVFERIL